MSLIFISENLDQLPKIAKDILASVSSYNKFLLYADMGVGKTTLIKALSLQLGVEEGVSSPTFSIVNEYTSRTNVKIYHFDFYRLKDEEEVFDLGFEDYLLQDAYCFIEWPERAPNLIKDDMVVIKIRLDGKKRIIEIII